MFSLVLNNYSTNNVEVQRFVPFECMLPKLIVQDGLEDVLHELIYRVLKTVKHIRASSSRQQKFIEDANRVKAP